MAQQSFIWTSLPHGVADGSLRLAVYLSPRLGGVETGAPLSVFPLWAAWTQQVQVALPDLQFDVRVRTAVDAPLQSLGLHRPDPELARQLWPEGWQALFGAATVQPFVMTSISNRSVEAYPAGELNGDLKRRYNRASAVAVARDDDAQRTRGRNRALIAAPTTDESPTAAMRSFLAFQEAAAGPDSMAGANEHREQPADRREFHEILAWLGSYPELLPRLGLVFELRIPRSDLAIATGEIQIQASPMLAGQEWPPRCRPGEVCPAEVAHHAPFTVVDAASFWPRAGDPDDSTPGSVQCGALSTGGLLCPGGDESGAGRMLVSQIDFEGATLKLTSAPARDPVTGGGASAFAAAERALPALRNAGYSLIRAGQAAVATTQARQAERNNDRLELGEAPLLWAQNISRGYRLDVFEDRTFTWHSLHARDLTYGLLGEPPRESVASEGFVQLAATVARDAGAGAPNAPDLLLLETLARWSGWSLTVPRPMAAADPVLTEPTIPAPNPFGVTIEQSIPAGSLPRLRYGGIYRFRIRTVDLVGHSPSLTEATQAMNALLFVRAPSWASAVPGSDRDHRYLRFEPIAPPLIVPRVRGASGGKVQRPSAGMQGVDDLDDVVNRLVLRSNGSDASAQVYAELFPQWALTNQLHLVPPRTAPATAEAHGMFDDAFDQGGDDACNAVFDLCLRDGDLPEFEQLPELALPYLPDPLARGVAVRVLGDPEELAGGVGEHITFCRYRAEPAWPDLLPFRLELGEDAAYRQPVYDAAARLLTVKLPPGGQAKVALSSFFRRPNDTIIPKDLASLGIWAWFDDLRLQVAAGREVDGITPESPLGQALALMGEEIPRAKRRAGEGRFWFLTPPQSLLLVHALQQPLHPPQITLLSAVRSPGQTSASLRNEISIHPESTARLALTASWHEIIDASPAPPKWLPIDDPRGDQRQLEVRAPIREQQILEPHDQGEHPYLWAEGEANAWWPRKATISLRAEGALEGPGTEDEVAIAASGARLPGNPDTTPLRHELGDTKHRQVTYRLIGTSRFQDDFPPPGGVDRETWTSRPSDPVSVNILSSARPIPPVIRGVKPAFLRRTERQSGALIRHKWGGVRVYLDRPWFTTGDDESLAVVLWGGANWPLPVGHRAASFSTRWGRDPIWKPAGQADQLLVPSRPTVEHFPLREQPGLDEALHTVPNAAALGTSFQVAAHRVRFNVEKNLWFADIQVDLGDAYFPFVQLALGRFQPHSVGNLHLSEVNLVDLVQIAPYRRVEATIVEGAPRLLQLSVAGMSEATTEGPGGLLLPSNRVRVQVERRVRGADDLGWLPSALPGPVESDPRDPTSDLLWSGRIPLPRPRDDDELRVLVLEDDFLATDGQRADELVPTPRLAYAESINLDDLMLPRT